MHRPRLHPWALHVCVQVRMRTTEGAFELAHVDELVDDMLRKTHLFDIALPRLPARAALVALGVLEPRMSVLEDDFDEEALEVRPACAKPRCSARNVQRPQNPAPAVSSSGYGYV